MVKIPTKPDIISLMKSMKNTSKTDIKFSSRNMIIIQTLFPESRIIHGIKTQVRGNFAKYFYQKQSYKQKKEVEPPFFTIVLNDY